MADIDVRESGASVRASPGDRIVLELPENATTGYQWVLEDLGEPLELESSELILSQSAAPGAGGERRVILRARSRGQVRVALELRREWEREAYPAARFEVAVTVR